MKDGFFYRANLLLNYRLGEFWKLNGLYEYSRQRTSAGGYNKAFIQQTWGGRVSHVFLANFTFSAALSIRPK